MVQSGRCYQGKNDRALISPFEHEVFLMARAIKSWHSFYSGPGDCTAATGLPCSSKHHQLDCHPLRERDEATNMIQGTMSSEFKCSQTWLPALQAVARLVRADLQPRRINWLFLLEAETCTDTLSRCLPPRTEGSSLPGAWSLYIRCRTTPTSNFLTIITPWHDERTPVVRVNHG